MVFGMARLIQRPARVGKPCTTASGIHISFASSRSARIALATCGADLESWFSLVGIKSDGSMQRTPSLPSGTFRHDGEGATRPAIKLSRAVIGAGSAALAEVGRRPVFAAPSTSRTSGPLGGSARNLVGPPRDFVRSGA